VIHLQALYAGIRLIHLTISTEKYEFTDLQPQHCIIVSGRLYQKNIIPILILTSVIIAPAFLLGFAGFSEVESIVFFLSVRVLEAAVTLGIIGTAFGSYFPSLGILRVFRSIILLGTIHVAILQYLLFITGVMGLTLPFPLNIVVIALWLGGLLLTSMSQPVL
jgi:NADH:ubiquinone oxidoreductase subunit K